MTITHAIKKVVTIEGGPGELTQARRFIQEEGFDVIDSSTRHLGTRTFQFVASKTVSRSKPVRVSLPRAWKKRSSRA
jgi:aminoglycoside N3'-acetyltransferase